MSQLTQAVRRSLSAWLAACALIVAIAALALVWIGRAGAERGQASGGTAVSKSISTAITKADAVDSTDSQCTSSNNFQDMPGALVSFRSGGQGARSVLALFQGEWNTGPSNTAMTRLTIDGVVQSGPSDVRQIFDDVGTHGFNFVSDPLAPGLHVARIQWRSINTQTVCVEDRSLIVLHK